LSGDGCFPYSSVADLPFRTYFEEWIERYHGRKGLRESTREDYRRDLRRYAYPFFDERLGRTVSQVSPRDVARFVAWLADEGEQGKRLSDATVRRILAPVRSCFATAVREGLIRHNPATGAALPHRPKIEEDDEEVRVLTQEQLGAFLDLVHPRYRTFFYFLAATGFRWGDGNGAPMEGPAARRVEARGEAAARDLPGTHRAA